MVKACEPKKIFTKYFVWQKIIKYQKQDLRAATAREDIHNTEGQVDVFPEYKEADDQ